MKEKYCPLEDRDIECKNRCNDCLALHGTHEGIDNDYDRDNSKD